MKYLQGLYRHNVKITTQRNIDNTPILEEYTKSLKRARWWKKWVIVQSGDIITETYLADL